ncbi:MAG TPA: glycosyltransferase [Candidatus Polarisedimenticolaceae bacterium]|nr:glycosyltransferase [Candidatus Polarisedimenticolaceae bacterium]
MRTVTVPSPEVTVIVTVHNGSSGIRRKLDNLIDQDYPRDRFEIVVADDASTDGTDRIVETEYGNRGVRLVRLEIRGGKERAQQAAVSSSRGEILVFTDVGTLLDPGGIAAIVRPFSDSLVGAVSSVDRFVTHDGSPAGEGLYVRYEMALRSLESRVGSLVGLSGSLFAARRAVCVDFSDQLASDFRTALVAVRLGYRAVSDDAVHGYYTDLARRGGEFDRKVRTVIRGLTVLFAERELMNPLRHGIFAWQLLSHKVGRWTVPLALIVTLVGSALATPVSLSAALLLGLQLMAYAGAVVAAAVPLLGETGPGRLLRYFVEVNASIVVAWTRFLRGERIVAWSPSRR